MCIKIQVNRIKHKFLMCPKPLMGRRSEYWEFLLSRFLCVSGRGGRNRNQTCHETFHIHPPFFFFFLFTQMNSSIPRFHAIKCPCLCGRMVQKQVMQKGEIGLYLSSSIAPAFFSSLFISLRLPRLCLPVCLALRCDVSVVFSQTQPVTLWAAGCCHRRLHADAISLPHPPSYIKFATGPL